LKIFYINLDSAKKRKKFIKKEAKKIGITLNRVIPFSLQETKKIYKDYNTNITLPEASLFLTNEKIIKENIGSNEHILILEDDVKFSYYLNDVLNLIENDFKEDLLFLECSLNVLNLEYYKNLKSLYTTLKENNHIQKIEAKKYFLAGANAVIYNKNSLNKISSLLHKHKLKTFYDLLLREFIQTNQLKANIIFPFTVGLNLNQATKSQLATKKDLLLKYSLLIRDSFYIKNDTKNANKYYLKFVKNYIK